MSLEEKINAMETELQNLRARVNDLERRAQKARKARVRALMAALGWQIDYVVLDNGGDGSLGYNAQQLSAKLKEAIDSGAL